MKRYSDIQKQLPQALVLFVLMLLFLFSLTGCHSKEKTDSLSKIKNLEFTVLSEDMIPKELQKAIQDKGTSPFKITYTDNGFLYIAIGYGEQTTGGFSITVNDLYLTQNAIYFDTTLLGPSPDSELPKSDTASYPYLVVKTEYIDEPVVFQ